MSEKMRIIVDRKSGFEYRIPERIIIKIEAQAKLEERRKLISSEVHCLNCKEVIQVGKLEFWKTKGGQIR